MKYRRITTILSVFIFLAASIYFYLEKTPNLDPNVGTPIAEVIVPSLSNSAVEGEKLFNANCAVCHGLNAAGKQGVAPPLVHIIYEPNHHGDQSFVLAAKNGVRAHHWPFGNMPPVEGVRKEEIKQITLYVRELQRANGIF